MKDIDENGVDRIERFRGYSQRFTQFSVIDEVYRETLEYTKHLRQQRDEARENLRDACAEIARIETRFYDALTPQQIAERNGWTCFAQQEGGGA